MPASWLFLPPAPFSNLTVPCWIIGGWAIDLAAGRVTRNHADVDAVAAVLDAKDDDFTQIFAGAEQSAVGPAASRPYACQVIAPKFADLVRLADQGGGRELDDARCANPHGQPPGARRKGQLRLSLP
jgi:hypothetical protein